MREHIHAPAHDEHIHMPAAGEPSRDAEGRGVADMALPTFEWRMGKVFFDGVIGAHRRMLLADDLPAMMRFIAETVRHEGSRA